MANRYNLFYFEAEFKKYLVAGNAEPSTIKNYLSDIHFFLIWVKSYQAIDELAYSELPEVFSHSLIRSYVSYLNTNIPSQKTVNRRISTVRKFFKLCVEQQWIQTNPIDQFDSGSKIDEKEQIIAQYRESLHMKNYPKSDIDRQINVIKSLIINSNIL